MLKEGLCSKCRKVLDNFELALYNYVVDYLLLCLLDNLIPEAAVLQLCLRNIILELFVEENPSTFKYLPSAVAVDYPAPVPMVRIGSQQFFS